MPPHATPVSITGTGTVHTGVGTLAGFFLFSTAGATVTIYDGTSAAGTILAKFTLAAGGALESIGRVRFGTGIHVVASAAVEGSIRLG